MLQNVLGENSERLANWLLNRDARHYVCGRKDLRENVLGIIHQAIVDQSGDAAQADELINKKIQDKRICFELF